jgi:hypothetical protein
VIVAVVPVRRGDEVERFVVRVQGRGKDKWAFSVRQVFVDDIPLKDPYDVELYEAHVVKVFGEPAGGVRDEAVIYTPEYYFKRVRRCYEG